VTRLGEFSLLGDCFSKITVAARFFGYSFPWKKLWINFDKKCVVLHFGRFFTNSSGVDVMNNLWSQFSAIFDNFRRKKLAFFSETNVLINFFLQNLALFWVKNANFFADFFGENIQKIMTSVPGSFGFNLFSHYSAAPLWASYWLRRPEYWVPYVQAGWPDEFVKKIAQNVAQLIFWQNYCTALLWKEVGFIRI
jgi:hypothetical protein